jgi:RND superfamily putative drug exporter
MGDELGAPARARKNLAARMGSWSARHRKAAIFGWLAFVTAAFVLGGLTGTKRLSDADTQSGESHRAAKIIAGVGLDRGDAESVLVQSRTQTARTPEFRAAISAVLRALASTSGVSDLRSPYVHPDQIAGDGHSALIRFRFGAKPDPLGRPMAIERVVAAVDRAARSQPEFFIGEFGDASANKALDDSTGRDFHRAEYLSIPVSLAILLFAFGALVAAGIPVLLALTAVLAAFGLLAFPSQLWPADDAATSVILLIGLAVGVDYSLFYIRREREERARGSGPEAALEAAAATSGRAVLLSGLTVLIAMAGMFLTGNKVFTSIAVGTMIVVAVAVAGSLTVLPALLSLLGDRVDKGGISLLARRNRRAEPRLLAALVDRVLRRPLLWSAVAAGALLLLAVPAFSLHTNDAGQTALPQNLEIAKTYERLQRAFPGGAEPAYVAVRADDVRSAPIRAAIAELKRRALASGEMSKPIGTTVASDGTAAAITIPLAGSGTDKRSEHALELLRKRLLPETLGRMRSVQVGVTGLTADSKDMNDLLKVRTPIVFAFVLGLAFLLLLAAFRSIVIALKAVVLNLLSVGAAYGLLVAIFQWGWGESLLGFKSTHGITLWLPLFLFVVLFGLSMDYHVFILTRVREAYDRGLDTEAAIAHGVKTTAGVVTGAACVMVGVFAIFATLSQIEMKQLGVGLASAILIDATVVRAVLLPATMKLLGDWNWYLPGWLAWLPQLSRAQRTAAARESASAGSPA